MSYCRVHRFIIAAWKYKYTKYTKYNICLHRCATPSTLCYLKVHFYGKLTISLNSSASTKTHNKSRNHSTHLSLDCACYVCPNRKRFVHAYPASDPKTLPPPTGECTTLQLYAALRKPIGVWHQNTARASQKPGCWIPVSRYLMLFDNRFA